MVVFETNFGQIEIALHDEATPKTVDNFLAYVKAGYYDGTIFHRVIDNFMIQGGGFESGMVKKDTNMPIKNEAHLGKQNTRGTLAMARTSDPDSATAQFFINVTDNPYLNHKSKTNDGFGYCVFGEVVTGMDVVDKIKKVKTTSRMGHGDVPVDDVIIVKAYLKEEA